MALNSRRYSRFTARDASLAHSAGYHLVDRAKVDRVGRKIADCDDVSVPACPSGDALSKDFARSHPLLTATVVTTVTAHIAHAVWGRMVDSKEAPLALGMAVIVGYILVLLGAVSAFMRERRRSRER